MRKQLSCHFFWSLLTKIWEAASPMIYEVSLLKALPPQGSLLRPLNTCTCPRTSLSPIGAISHILPEMQDLNPTIFSPIRQWIFRSWIPTPEHRAGTPMFDEWKKNSASLAAHAKSYLFIIYFCYDSPLEILELSTSDSVLILKYTKDWFFFFSCRLLIFDYSFKT